MLGYVTVSYAHLYALLGESLGGDGYKVSTEWYVKDNQTGRTFKQTGCGCAAIAMRIRVYCTTHAPKYDESDIDALFE